jgi:hypothetical protein
VCHLSQLEIFSSHPLVVEELQRQDVFEVAGLLNKEKNKTASSGYKNKQTTGSRGMLAATKRGGSGTVVVCVCIIKGRA